MTRRIVLLLGLLVAFTLPMPAQEMTPAQAKLRAKTIQLFPKDGLLVVVSEAGEKYTTYLHILLPTMKKGSDEDGHQVLPFDNAYEAVLLRRVIVLFSNKLAFSTDRYDGQNQEEKKEAGPKRLETFMWDVSGNNLSVEFTPGIFKDGTIVALDEQLKYLFDLKKDTISLEGSSSRQLDTDDAEIIRMFLDFFAVYARESNEWYEVETNQKQKAPLPPEKAAVLIPPRILGVFLYQFPSELFL